MSQSTGSRTVPPNANPCARQTLTDRTVPPAHKRPSPTGAYCRLAPLSSMCGASFCLHLADLVTAIVRT
jgi:hypothetical protein